MKNKLLTLGPFIFLLSGCLSVDSPSFNSDITETTDTSPASSTTPITAQPIKRVAPAQRNASTSCNPNYSGCVPIASDVDFEGGSGMALNT